MSANSIMLTAALELAKRGCPVFPCHWSGERAKRPLVDRGFNAATKDPAKIREWWVRWPDALIGMPTGEASGIVVLDIDLREDRSGFDAIPNWKDRSPVQVRTPSGGAHLYFRAGGKSIRNSVGKIAPGIDVRGDGGYVIVPPSIIDGTPYQWIGDDLCDVTDLPDFPPDLLQDLLQKERKKKRSFSNGQKNAIDPFTRRLAECRLRAFCEEIAAAVEGTRNDTLNRLAFVAGQWVGAAALDRNVANQKLTDAARQNGLDDDEIKRTVSRALDDGEDDPCPPVLVLDPGNPLHAARELVAVEFTDEHGRRTLRRYRGTFYIWNGACYREISDEDLRSRVWELLGRASVAANDELRPFKPKKAVVANIVEAIQAVCRVDPLPDAPFWLSEDPKSPPPKELFACQNGLLHIPSGNLFASTPDYFGLTASEVKFDPNATSTPHWDKFINDIFGDDRQSIDLLEEWFGYTLTSDTSLQKILLIIGPPRSGKGTIVRCLTNLLGTDSVASPTMDALSSNFGLWPLIGKPLATISDARIGKRSNTTAITERLLSISGEDPLTVDRKHKEPWTGRLSTRICMLTNELPALGDASGALAKRYMVIELRNSFYGREDLSLEDNLTAELPGILNRAIAGYRRLKKGGHFVQPDSARPALAAIDRLAAPVRAFVEDCCDLGADKNVLVADLYAAYKGWCEGAGYRSPQTKEWFGRQLRAAFPQIDNRRPRDEAGKQQSTYRGIALNDRSQPF